MASLKTPEKKRELKSYREKRAAQQRDLQQRFKQDKRQGKKIYLGQHGLDSFNETSVKLHDVGQMRYTCSECGALMLKDEKK